MRYVIVRREGWHEVWVSYSSAPIPVHESRHAQFKSPAEAIRYVREKQEEQ